jgi:hypothetical protein
LHAAYSFARRFVMNKLIIPFMFAMAIGVGMASFSFAADVAKPSTQTVNGDLLKIEGEFYVVKDILGKETRLHVDKTTTMDGSINVGEKVEAQATEKNHALSIRHIQPKK